MDRPLNLSAMILALTTLPCWAKCSCSLGSTRRLRGLGPWISGKFRQAMKHLGDNARARLLIEGRVQGVFFRASAEGAANRLEIKGWVRNCPDGSVELLAEGEKNRLDDLIAWCRHGPRGAQVENVRVEWEEFKGEFTGFRITR